MLTVLQGKYKLEQNNVYRVGIFSEVSENNLPLFYSGKFLEGFH